MAELFNRVRKLIFLFYEMSKKYTRDQIASSCKTYTYEDDGNGNITITED